MATLPQLLEQDIERLHNDLSELLRQTEATTALIIDRGGFLITSEGDTEQFNLITLAALASGAFMANQTIAGLVHETNFNSIYQQGDKFSMFVLSVDEHCLLVVIFNAHVNVGLVKYYATPATARIAEQLHLAYERDPSAGLDLSELNLADTAELFKKKGEA
jgi:predicted regulator of Ras-like GTPase activity (Roadblock/LC7/MglB family)